MAHYDKSSISIFQQIFTSTDKIFISGGGLSAMGIIEIFLIFRKFLRSWDLRCLTCSKAAGIYQFITNNRASFHLWWEENLLKISKYYEHDCSLKKRKDFCRDYFAANLICVPHVNCFGSYSPKEFCLITDLRNMITLIKGFIMHSHDFHKVFTRLM